MQLDDRLSTSLRILPSDSKWHHLFAFLAHSGDSWFWLMGLGILWLMGDPTWNDIAVILGIGIVFQAVLILVIKFSVRRRRPPGEWGAIYRNTDPHSFPSGHAARAALLAVMAFGLGPPWFGWILIIWAPLVSLARVMMGVHYLSDVLVGILIGIIIGFGVLAAQPLIMEIVPFLFS